MYDLYTETISIIEHLHRRCLQVIKIELDRQGVRDINNIQALIIFNISHEELTVGELTLRGCYHGSNVSYNLKKLVDQGYVDQAQSPHDRRSFRVKLTDRGQEVRQIVENLFQFQSEGLKSYDIEAKDLQGAREILHKLDRFWSMSSEAGMH